MNPGYCSLNSHYMYISSSVHTRGFMNPRTCSWYLKDQCGLKPMRDEEYCFPNPKEEFEIKRNRKKKGKMGENKMKNNFIFQFLVLEIDTWVIWYHIESVGGENFWHYGRSTKQCSTRMFQDGCGPYVMYIIWNSFPVTIPRDGNWEVVCMCVVEARGYNPGFGKC